MGFQGEIGPQYHLPTKLTSVCSHCFLAMCPDAVVIARAVASLSHSLTAGGVAECELHSLKPIFTVLSEGATNGIG